MIVNGLESIVLTKNKIRFVWALDICFDIEVTRISIIRIWRENSSFRAVRCSTLLEKKKSQRCMDIKKSVETYNRR